MCCAKGKIIREGRGVSERKGTCQGEREWETEGPVHKTKSCEMWSVTSIYFPSRLSKCLAASINLQRASRHFLSLLFPSSLSFGTDTSISKKKNNLD